MSDDAKISNHETGPISDGLEIGDEHVFEANDVLEEETLRAIQEAFGEEALNLIKENELPFDPSMMSEESDGPSLDDILSGIDHQVQMRGVDAQTEELAATATASRLATGVQYIAVELDKTLVGLPMGNVLEVQQVPTITPIPHVPFWLRGVANMRGDIISVVDARAFFGMESMDQGFHRRLVVIQSHEHARTTGLLVDRVIGLRTVEADRVKAPKAPDETMMGQHTRGVVSDGEELTAILDIESLLGSRELSQFESS